MENWDTRVISTNTCWARLPDQEKRLMKMNTLAANPSLLTGYCAREAKYTGKKSLALLSGVMTALVVLIASAASAQSFRHVVIVVQENRTPDNLFQGLCSPSSCGPYNIQQTNWKNLHAADGVTTPQERYLVDTYDLGHFHKDFTRQYDSGKMDGADLGSCAG